MVAIPSPKNVREYKQRLIYVILWLKNMRTPGQVKKGRLKTVIRK